MKMAPCANLSSLKSLEMIILLKHFVWHKKHRRIQNLYYNDYNIEQPKKRAGAIALIKKIQAAGVRIDGVGIQGHWKADNVPMKDIEESIKEFSALGIEVMFTELDLSVLPNPWDNNYSRCKRNRKRKCKNESLCKWFTGFCSANTGKSYADLFTLF